MLEIIALTPPPVRGLGQSSGFTLELLNSSGMPRERFLALRNRLLGQAMSDPGSPPYARASYRILRRCT